MGWARSKKGLVSVEPLAKAHQDLYGAWRALAYRMNNQMSVHYIGPSESWIQKIFVVAWLGTLHPKGYPFPEHLIVQGQHSMALAVVDAGLHETGVDLAARWQGAPS